MNFHRNLAGLLSLCTAVCGGVFGLGNQLTEEVDLSGIRSIYDFTMVDINGTEVPLANFSGKVLLVVNVASRCGYTYQYEGLEKLYETYRDSGFVILGFPANNFLHQEPGSNREILEFCTSEYGVYFPMFAKISVKGKDQDPLYRYLTDEKIHPETGGAITWNFNKFLVDRQGRIVGRFGTKTEPLAPELTDSIEKHLKMPVGE